MMTLEQAIRRLEDMVSGCYQQQFPESELRKNTKASVEMIRFNFMSILKLQNEDVRKSSYDTILHTVLDNTPLPKSWQKRGMKTYLDLCINRNDEVLNSPDIAKECIECCDVILKRLKDEDAEESSNDHELYELNRKYFHKYFYFRNNDVGSQYVWVKKITRDDMGHFNIDGTVIYTNGVNNTIGLYEVKDSPIENFYNFGDKNRRFTTCEDFECALQQPMEYGLKSHIITCKDAAKDILFIFTWFYEIHIPEMAKILKSIKFGD